MKIAKLQFICLVVLSLMFTQTATASQNRGESRMLEIEAVAAIYYGAFRGEFSAADIPLRDEINFKSPIAEINKAAAFRGALGNLFTRVQKLTIDTQLMDETTVMSFYWLDLGAPGGPIPMAERLTVKDGAITAIQLLFDPSLLPAPPKAE
ncbi:MAG: hypothetical protein AAF542_24545 [Pseudomonadota bacterium]